MSRRTLQNRIVKKFTDKDAGKKELNAGSARRVMQSLRKLWQKDPEFKGELLTYLDS